MKDLVIIGAGGFGREVLDTIIRINGNNPQYNVVGFVDDDPEIQNMTINDVPVIGNIDTILKMSNEATYYGTLAIGSAKARENIVDKLGDSIVWENIIDPSVILSEYATLGKGIILQPFVIVCANATIGDFCVVNMRSTISHDVVLGEYVSIMSYCDMTGYVNLEDNVYLGSSVKIIPEKTIGKDTTVGAGAVVINDIPANCVAVGCPAKPVKWL